MKLGLQVFDTNQRVIADWTNRIQGLQFSTGLHGFRTLTGFVPMSPRESMSWYQRGGLPGVRLGTGSIVAFDGRLEDLSMVRGGVDVGVYGFWAAYHDLKYTAMWSDSSSAEWVQLDDVASATFIADTFEFDNNNRVRLAPRKNETFSTTTIGAVGYRVPHNSERNLAEITFTYEFVAPAPWTVVAYNGDEDYAPGITTGWSLVGNGVTQSGTTTQALNTKSIVIILVYNGAATTFAGETGDIYLKITGMRIKTTDSDALYGDEIAKALVAYAVGRSPSQVSSEVGLIQSPGLDIEDFVVQDATPGDALALLEKMGDSQTPSREWTAAVWENKMLSFAPVGYNGRSWGIDVGTIELERSANRVVNTAYAKYAGVNETRRTDRAMDAMALAALGGVSREAVHESQTTSVSRAETERDTLLAILSGEPARARIATRGLFDMQQARWPFWIARSGERAAVRNLRKSLSALDFLRDFRIKETSWSQDTNELTLIPAELPSLEVVLGGA